MASCYTSVNSKGRNLKSAKLIGCAIALVGAGAGLTANAQALHDIPNAGTQSWSAAATTGRADMVVLGDSVVWVQGFGWDEG